MTCPECGAECVGDSTLSKMTVFKCRSTLGGKGLAQSDVCHGRAPLHRALIQATMIGSMAQTDPEKVANMTKEECEALWPDMAEWMRLQAT